jgi:hypothetical protein
MAKKCYGCKKNFEEQFFIDINDKNPTHIYSKCNSCRVSISQKKGKNNCTICNIRAIYNFAGQTYGIRCSKHKEPSMIDVKNKKCIVCKNKIPCFNLDGTNIATHCNDCKQPSMVNVKDKKCVVCKIKQPVFNIKDKTNATHCGDCKEPSMVNVKDKKCVVCKTRIPTFNLDGQSKATHCGDCKESSMIDVKSKKCIICKLKRPNFNLDGQSNATHCGDCKEPSMVDVKHPKCVICKLKIPTFNLKEKSKATHCSDCKESSMVNVIDKKCVICKIKIPTFNLDGQSKATHCGDCKESSMIDVKSKKCIEKGCRKRAYYAQSASIPQYCANHKKIGMFSEPRKKCQIDNCVEMAIFGITKPEHCEKHKKEDDYNFAERECIKCKNIDILNRNGICINFCSLEEKDRLMKKYVKKHEESIGLLLKAEIDLNLTYRDQIIEQSCSKKRPDFVYHCGTHILIIEVDEDQHKSYRCTAYGDNKEGRIKGEQIRMFEIAQSFDGLPVIFLRYNPDNFKLDGKIQKYPTSKRHDLLIKWVRMCIRSKYSKGFTVKYLFYDDFKESDGDFQEINVKDVL